jgi:hypothetical protein
MVEIKVLLHNPVVAGRINTAILCIKVCGGDKNQHSITFFLNGLDLNYDEIQTHLCP